MLIPFGPRSKVCFGFWSLVRLSSTPPHYSILIQRLLLCPHMPAESSPRSSSCWLRHDRIVLDTGQLISRAAKSSCPVAGACPSQHPHHLLMLIAIISGTSRLNRWRRKVNENRIPSEQNQLLTNCREFACAAHSGRAVNVTAGSVQEQKPSKMGHATKRGG